MSCDSGSNSHKEIRCDETAYFLRDEGSVTILLVPASCCPAFAQLGGTNPPTQGSRANELPLSGTNGQKRSRWGRTGPGRGHNCECQHAEYFDPGLRPIHGQRQRLRKAPFLGKPVFHGCDWAWPGLQLGHRRGSSSDPASSGPNQGRSEFFAAQPQRDSQRNRAANKPAVLGIRFNRLFQVCRFQQSLGRSIISTFVRIFLKPSRM